MRVRGMPTSRARRPKWRRNRTSMSIACRHSRQASRGIRRQTISDCADTGSDGRFRQLSLAPGTACPAWRATVLTDFWVRGGALQIDGRTAHANCFVVVEAGTTVNMAAPFGALLLAWAEGPGSWIDVAGGSVGSRPPQSSPIGF